MNEKITGYSLLGMGIVTMLFALVQVYLVFTNKQSPPAIFNANGISLNAAQLLSGGQLPQGLTKQGAVEIFSGKDLNKTLNMSAHFFLMSFILGFGFKIASLGIMLLRPVNVKMRDEKPLTKLPTPTQSPQQKT